MERQWGPLRSGVRYPYIAVVDEGSYEETVGSPQVGRQMRICCPCGGRELLRVSGFRYDLMCQSLYLGSTPRSCT